MIPVQHGRDPVKTEAVQMILFHPIFAVGQQKILHRILSIVEASGSPCRMMSGFSWIEVQILASVKQAEPFDFIGNRMRMHYVHYYRYPFGMGLVHQTLELLGSAET